MNRRIFCSSLVIFLTALVSSGAAQNFNGCAVSYQQTVRYDFEAVFGTFENQEYNDWVASLPTKHQSNMLLYLTEEKSLYFKDPADAAGYPKRLQEALLKADYVRGPQIELVQVYRDFKTNLMVRQLQFMTRSFRVETPREERAWKLTDKRIKILDRICMGAETKEDDNQILAWFSPEIPISAGPAHYAGLPGLILALEINGETAYLATKIEMTPPPVDELKYPGRGKELSGESFDELVEQKIREWQDTNKSGRFKGKK